jgi:hypothetical protein
MTKINLEDVFQRREFKPISGLLIVAEDGGLVAAVEYEDEFIESVGLDPADFTRDDTIAVNVAANGTVTITRVEDGGGDHAGGL